MEHRLRTPGWAGYNLAWSPFFEHRLALASSANYGLVGNGRLHILRVGPTGTQVEKTFDTQDGLFDIAWSELHENQLVTASGDGSIKLWDIGLHEFPIRNWHEHKREVFSVDWNNIKKDLFATSSWDETVKLWHPERPASLTTLHAHTGCVYAAIFSPHSPDTIATCSADGTLRLFDLRQPNNVVGPSGLAAAAAPAMTIQVGGEVLCLDWNKYRPMTVATGSVDRSVKVWDLRMVAVGPGALAGGGGGGGGGATLAAALLGHEYAVRKVAWSPHSPSLLASASYDMTARVWDVDAASASSLPGAPALGSTGVGGALKHIHDAHTEFVVGLSWSLYVEGWLASCAWDQHVHVWPALGSSPAAGLRR